MVSFILVIFQKYVMHYQFGTEISFDLSNPFRELEDDHKNHYLRNKSLNKLSNTLFKIVHIFFLYYYSISFQT